VVANSHSATDAKKPSPLDAKKASQTKKSKKKKKVRKEEEKEPATSIDMILASPSSESPKKSKKKKKVRKEEEKEPATSIDTILASPSSENPKVTLVSQNNVIKSPPAFLLPTGAMNLTDVEIPADSKNWKLSSKLSKGCKVLDPLKSPEISRNRELKIPVAAAETIVYVCTKKDANGDVLTKHIESNSLSDLTITRTHRSAILTKGSLQFKKASFSMVQCVVFLKEKEYPNINISLLDLRGICVDENTVIVAYRQQQQPQEKGDTIRYTIYQTVDTDRFILQLARAIIPAYICVPRWAIPLTWSGKLPHLDPISQPHYELLMGPDGGLSSHLYATELAYHARKKLYYENESRGFEGISKAIMKLQPSTRSSADSNRPKVIDIAELASVLAPKEAGLQDELVLAGLNALSFNLVFRKLKLAKIGARDPSHLSTIRNALGRTLLYNVTLREVDFESAHMSGFGETIGNAWAMNVQPLISRINFSGCGLTNNDMNGLLRGLARIWCGGMALAEVIRMANNPNVSTENWDVFFRTFVDPSTLSSWPQQPPPPANLSFLQELDVRDTNAVGPGLVEIAGRLTGLRCLKLSSKNRTKASASDVLLALLMANAPLEKCQFEGRDSGIVEALFRHHRTLKEIKMVGFIGDGRPLLCDWPEPVPNLTLDIGKRYVPESSSWSHPSGSGYSPGTILLSNSNNFTFSAIEALANSATGLKKLVIWDICYWYLAVASFSLANCGLEILHIYPPEHHSNDMPGKTRSIETFWETLARSKTLRDLQCSGQLLSNEVAMVGRFLKKNRSIQRIGFDHKHLILNVEDVKVLRSAFFGNKKVIEMEYLVKAREATLKRFALRNHELIRQVMYYKSEIKQIFRRAYSKYNRNWRAGPNRDKLPWVDKIRVAKREIGRLEREQAKIVSLLHEIMSSIANNRRTQGMIEDQKANERIERRGAQLTQLAAKKKKVATDLVTKLRKAKLRGRQKKSAKMQVHRPAYYKSKNIWPSNVPFNNHRIHSFYDFYNDPYQTRYYIGFEDDSSCESDNANFDSDWLESAFCQTSVENMDPWANVDSLIHELDRNYDCAIDRDYLGDIHQECSELGIDVLEAILQTLDLAASLACKLDEIGSSMNVSSDVLNSVVDSNLEEQFDLSAIESTLPDVDGYTTDAMDDVMDADDAVGMYAGAGPRDLDDGGPSFGGAGNSALAGARRRARARKNRRSMSRVREKINRRLKYGYENLSISETVPALKICQEESLWPEDIVSSWMEEARMRQIRAVAESDLFDLPNVSSRSSSLLTEWSVLTNKLQPSTNIEVVLVTQCSVDRLANLQAQLARWSGKASIAIYLKSTENKTDAIDRIFSTVKKARAIVGDNRFDVVVTLVEGCMEEEPYPINYLRNVALLEAQRQHLRFHASLEKSACLLVDADFRPSSNLHKTLHSTRAENAILKEGKIVICPAFECTTNTCPSSTPNLEALVGIGQAEGFHQSHFPQGHGPTNFDTFWEKSLYCLNCTDGKTSDCIWNEAYSVRHEELFEPYVVMASRNVPLYDERFQGYGLNKVSHLASVARQEREFLVLPGVFLVAPAHERSEAWGQIYGNSTKSDDNKKFNQLVLKGLYYNFMKGLESGREPVVSDSTHSKQQLLQKEIEWRQKESASNESIQSQPVVYPTEHIRCY
jgi:hypothetical protein